MAEARPGRRPRLWPAVAVVLLVLPALVVAQALALGAWRFAGGAVEDPADSVAYLLLATLAAQAAFAALALLGVALASVDRRAPPRPPLAALGLAPDPAGARPGLAPGARGAVLPAVLGTLFANAAAQLWWDLRYDEPSETLRRIGDSIATAPPAAFAALLVAFSVLPGICEELLFRGFLQRHLLARWRPAAAVGVASVLFAAVHFDPQHVWAVLPLALWLGYVGWRTDSVLPPIACHAFNNAWSMVMMRLEPGTMTETSPAWTLAALAVGLPAFLWTVLRLERRARAARGPLAGVRAP